MKLSFLVKTCAAMTIGLGWLAGSGCSSSSPPSADVSGEYLNHPHSIRLTLNQKDRSLLMTRGVDVLSSGFYYVKWKQLYCFRNDRCIVIGQVNNDRIVTELGEFVKQN